MSEVECNNEYLNRSNFSELGIEEKYSTVLASHGITAPTNVQKRIIPEILAKSSVLFESETGTGKTFAYLLPLVQSISSGGNEKKEIKLIVLSPTVELASQIKSQVKIITEENSALLVGGAPIKRQIELLKEKPSVVIGGPARLLELFHLKKLKIDSAAAVVLDEVDRLISPELRDETLEFLSSLNKSVQLIAASATISKATEKALASLHFSQSPKTIFLPPEDVLRKRITHIAIFSETRDKIETLRKLLVAEKGEKVLVFTSKIDQVANIVSKLKYRNIECEGIHAKADKVSRKQIIDKFRGGKMKILVTSDLSSRGLDFSDVTHVVQMDVPSNDDFFVHRAGRTARAGKTGCNVVIGDEYEMRKFSALEKRLGIVVYPKMLYKGKLVSPSELSSNEIEANEEN
ncbi:MAG: DEAD/DEAH box helicase [Treponema sp.]|uniref:DEAD/DEAH box helicase n=1 Tax=Treponema sp. TaxID=166 RepID=UPI0025D41B8E|nr:DEAD/DEAH box helicase [Treponema sp.]MBQ3671337.1 DEAD/DEAH box helicase [Treponema sp.]MBR0496194.1 DEAD/DEAH box helicase [Treponema sp.]